VVADAVESDPKALELVQNFNDRLGRTFEIIFSGAGGFDLLRFPQQLQLATE
jgi:hypothetical protein